MTEPTERKTQDRQRNGAKMYAFDERVDYRSRRDERAAHKQIVQRAIDKETQRELRMWR